MRKNIRRWLGIVLTAIVLGLIVVNFSRGQEWRAFRWDRLWVTIIQTNVGYLAAAVGLVYFSLLLRAFRWRAFLHPIKRGSLWIEFIGQVVGFGSVFFLGRVGELVRPAYIARKEEVPFTAMAAVWLVERIYDSVFIILMAAAALFLGPLTASTPQARAALARMHWAGGAVLLLTLALVGLLLVFRIRSEAWTRRLVRAFRFLSERTLQRFEHLLGSFAVGLGVLRSWKDFQASAISTVALWFVNTSVFWLVFHALGGSLARLSWLASALVLFMAALGMLAQVPGVGGGFQVLAILALTGFFAVPAEEATGASLMLWIVNSFPCMALGLIFLAHEGLSLRKVKAMAEKDRADLAKDA
jgi:glycosyltransferase 2 family protein